jgi:LDH2 family malate/lactate/ureidoglycolate dehydrogenase
MAPTGSCDAFFGTNPLGMSFPTGKGFPVRVDMATSMVARGRVMAAQKRGEPIPEGWCLDKEGRPTTDAAAALAGTMVPMAGHKGYALAFLVETLAGVLTGAAVGPELGSMYKHMDRVQNVGHFFMLMDVASLMDPALFRKRMDAMIDAIKAGRKQDGCKDLYVPGELEHRRATENRALGIPVEPRTLDEIKALCADLGVLFKL